MTSLNSARRAFHLYGHRKDEIGQRARRNYIKAVADELDKECDEKAAERERLQDQGRAA